MEGDPRQVDIVHRGFVMSLRLLPGSLTIEVSVRADRRLFYTTISRDSMTEQLIEIFGGECSEIYDFIAAGNFELEDPSHLILPIRIVNRVRRLPIHLAERVLSPRQVMLERKVGELEGQLHRLRGVERQSRDMHDVVVELRRQIAEERAQRTQRERQNILLRQQLKRSEEKMAILYNQLRESDDANKYLTHRVSELQQSKQQEGLSYEAITFDLQQQLESAQHQLLSTSQIGARKYEVVKPNKQAILTKIVTIKGNNYRELSEQLASAKNKKSITELCLENTCN